MSPCPRVAVPGRVLPCPRCHPARPEPLGPARLLVAHPGRPRLPGSALHPDPGVPSHLHQHQLGRCHLAPATGSEPLPQPQPPSAPSAAAIAAAPAPRGLPAPRLPRHQKNPRRGQEMPQGLRHRAPGAVVHGVPLEKGLPALPGLNSHLEFPQEFGNPLRNLGIPSGIWEFPHKSRNSLTNPGISSLLQAGTEFCRRIPLSPPEFPQGFGNCLIAASRD
ncbi:cuticle collagen 2C-like [Geospiza fortis]|uniref:Cuticle collagen 2C-like n=1 Tax=Geospiza fortis TaxID=48883 RepID=A0A8N5I4G5_GEOFO|nr:cuticle collagen 2C-like [Geospiza fortis]